MYRKYNIDTEKIRKEKDMIIKNRVLEARLAARILNDPDLAKEFGLEIRIENERSQDVNLDNRIRNLTSAEAEL